MGRRRLEIKRIEDKSARQVTFTKRRNGLFKKAQELSVLCEADVAAVIFSVTGKLYHYCSSNSLADTIRHYHNYVEYKSRFPTGDDGQEQARYSKYSPYITREELLQVMERELVEPLDDQRSVTDLVLLENQLQIALMQTRRAKTFLLLDALSGLQDEQEMEVEKEKNLLEDKIGTKALNKKKEASPSLNLNLVPSIE